VKRNSSPFTSNAYAMRSALHYQSLTQQWQQVTTFFADTRPFIDAWLLTSDDIVPMFDRCLIEGERETFRSILGRGSMCRFL